MNCTNIAVISGRLGRDVELKYTKSGSPVASFSVAVEEGYKKSDGTWNNVTHWIDCEAWGKQAESFAQSAVKGAVVVVHGKLKQQTWEDRNTNAKRSKILVSVTQAIVAESRQTANDRGDVGAHSEPPAQDPKQRDDHSTGDGESLPF